jgi:hypothetical protein
MTESGTPHVQFPRMVRIRQRLNHERLDNPATALSDRIGKSGILDGIEPGARIAITAGSRGIHGIVAMLATVVRDLKRAGAEPFIVPAMGSHGGGTADGQVKVLTGMGITEETIGAPVISSMETVLLGKTRDGVPVYIDRHAAESDGIVVMNRVKVHTAFHGPQESGLCKMIAVGLGKRDGAETFHTHGMGTVLADMTVVARAHAPLLLGVAILENAAEETLDISIAAPDDFERVDAELLEQCRKIVPGLPVRAFDILIVDRMGKNISGTGMDTNVIGFWRRYGGERDPDYRTLIVRALTPESGGNAMGIGMADLIPRRLADSIDMETTWTNAMTSQWALGRIPIIREHDRTCIEDALRKHDPLSARIVRITDTLHLETCEVSEPLVQELGDRTDIEIIGQPEPMRFDSAGSLLNPY